MVFYIRKFASSMFIDIAAYSFCKPGVTPVARLISSSYDANDLYSLLLRLSIGDDEKPTLATRHAISALSYQHLDKYKASSYQTSAICALQSSIETLVPSRAIQAMAASMLLSIFEVLSSAQT
jgi:hypothetical protein